MKGISDEDLMQILEEEVGTAPVSIRVADNPNRSQGLAFADFSTPEEANKVRAPGSLLCMRFVLRGQERKCNGSRRP